MQIPEIDKLIKSVVENLPSKVGPFNDELQEYLRQALASQLNKMDIVTRHEFDIQSAVLQRTRAVWKTDRPFSDRAAECLDHTGKLRQQGQTAGAHWHTCP